MAQNFLYMFEFIVDDLLVTRPNYCAPEEYPTCCDVTFRSSVFLSICDREFGQCVDPCSTNCGKCCVFSLDSPVTETDKLLIHIYKKKTDKCKFLVGCTELPIKSLFDKVMESFNIENPKWQEIQTKHANTLPNPKEPNTSKEIMDNDECDSDSEGRREQLCPTSEMTKNLLPIFDLKGRQTGNVVLIIRLVANGPCIVSSFPFQRNGKMGCNKKQSKCYSKSNTISCAVGGAHDLSGLTGGRFGNEACGGCGNVHKSTINKASTSKYCGNKEHTHFQVQNNGCIPMRDPCLKEVKKPMCQRYFACNADRGYPCEMVEDECQRVEDPLAKSDSWSRETCGDSVRNPPSGQYMQPCFRTPKRPDPGPEAYDEFEACLNGSGLVIRVLKDTHQVESICDGTEEFHDDKSNKFKQNCEKENHQRSECSLTKILHRSNFARNYIKRRTGGHIINHPNLPKIRANIKYSANDSCFTENYHVPYSKIKSYCNNQDNKIENYRSQRSKTNYDEYGPIVQPKHRKNERNCCVQVNREDIRNVMKDLDVDTRKKGIEVCYKTCEDTDSDVFLVKLGTKQKRERKKNNIEIELKTPKQPLVLPKQHVTTETQINETELDAALSDVCKKKKGKGKKKK